MKMPPRLLLTFLLLSCTLVVLRAQEALFIGNSYTYGGSLVEVKGHGGVPKMVEAIAQAKGKTINTTMVTFGGKGWDYHLTNPVTLEAMKKNWNDVIMQDFSTKPTQMGNKAEFLKTGEQMYDLIAEGSPKATLILYETFPRPPTSPFYKPGLPADKGFASPQVMYDQLHEGYMELFHNLQAKKGLTIRFAPVGTAFNEGLKTCPQINLYHPDNHHASALGSYLVALVIYAAIFDDTPVGATGKMPGFEVSEADATALQALAQDVLTKYKL